MASLSASFNLTGVIPGQSDPVGIDISNVILSVVNPSVTSGVKTTAYTGSPAAATKFTVLPKTGIGASKDFYVYVRNVGTNGDLINGGKVVIRDMSAQTNIQQELAVGDFCFVNVKAGLGLTAEHGNPGTSADTTNFVYAYFQRV
tara:strand:+ start:4137 stop:4571 length:435 start_codon:yes stop_codon:yes gene_type:complete